MNHVVTGHRQVRRMSMMSLLAALYVGGCGGQAARSMGTTGGVGGSDETDGDSGSGSSGTTGAANGDAGTGATSGSTGAGDAGRGGSSEGGARGTSVADASTQREVDAGPAASDGAAAGCGAAGQICCASNTCRAGATPTTAGKGGGAVVLELVASGGDPYALFGQKDLLPIDGPASGYITDTGTSFKFVLHNTGAEMMVSSGAKRQRNELTVNPGNPLMYKGLNGDTMSYTWRFHLDAINAHPTWCTIFQIKQFGPLGVAPLLQFRTQGDNLEIALRQTTARSLPLSAILGQWINASLTIKYGHAGTVALVLKKDDGSELLNYTNDNADMWDANTDFVRPKWGLYRNAGSGAGEASIQYNDMTIIHGTIPSACTCQ